MDDKEKIIEWLGAVLWDWQEPTDFPANPEGLAEEIIKVLASHQKQALQLSAHPLPDAQEFLRMTGTR